MIKNKSLIWSPKNIEVKKHQPLSKTYLRYTYKNIITPVVKYGSDFWAMTREQKRQLGIFKHKILRRFF